MVVLANRDSKTLTTPSFTEFLEKRHIQSDIAEKAGLYVPEDGPWAGWLAIPYPHMSGIWKTRYRRLDDGSPKYMDEKGAEPHLYNPQGLGPQTREVWFTEGELDALILWQYGVPAIGVPGAQVFDTKLFSEGWSLLFRRAQIFAALDNDEAGRRASQSLSKVFGDKVVGLELPDGLDVNDLHIKAPDELRRMIEEVR